MTNLLRLTDRGLYCPPADLYIDPWKPVQRAAITHAHGDHARFGSSSYLCSARGAGVLRMRIGDAAPIQPLAWNEQISLNGVIISFHPAGHILGSGQVRLEFKGEVAVVSGDYKIEPDRTCDPFEPVRCDTFVTESTFGLPIYRWKPEREIFSDINAWWKENQESDRTSIIFAYSLGKAQRVLSGIDPEVGPIAAHGSIRRLNEAYRAEGIALPTCIAITPENLAELLGKALVVAPPSVQNTPWIRKLAPYSTAFASGWMQVRGQRRRRGVDRGFPLSDHADWNGLLGAVAATGANDVWVTHGYTAQLVRWLQESGLSARELHTEFHPESDEETAEPTDEQ